MVIVTLSTLIGGWFRYRGPESRGTLTPEGWLQWTFCILGFLVSSALAAVLCRKTRNTVAVNTLSAKLTELEGEPGEDFSTKQAPDVSSSEGARNASAPLPPTGTVPRLSASSILPPTSVHGDVLPPSETGSYGFALYATEYFGEGADLNETPERIQAHASSSPTLAFPEIDTQHLGNTVGELAAALSMDTSKMDGLTMDLRALRKSTSVPPPPPTGTMPGASASSTPDNSTLVFPQIDTRRSGNTAGELAASPGMDTNEMDDCAMDLSALEKPTSAPPPPTGTMPRTSVSSSPNNSALAFPEIDTRCLGNTAGELAAARVMDNSEMDDCTMDLRAIRKPTSPPAPPPTGTMPRVSASSMLPPNSMHGDVLPPSETGGYGFAPIDTGYLGEGPDWQGLGHETPTWIQVQASRISNSVFPEIDTRRLGNTAGEVAAAPSKGTNEMDHFTMDLRALRKPTSPRRKTI